MHHKDVIQAHWIMKNYVCVCGAVEEAWAVMNKQALYWLWKSLKPTKLEQISQDSSVSIRCVSQILRLRLSRSHLMSSGWELLWHLWFNKNRHAKKKITNMHVCMTNSEKCLMITASDKGTFLLFCVIQYWRTCFVNLVDLFEHSFVPILRPIHRLWRET